MHPSLYNPLPTTQLAAEKAGELYQGAKKAFDYYWNVQKPPIRKVVESLKEPWEMLNTPMPGTPGGAIDVVGDIALAAIPLASRAIRTATEARALREHPSWLSHVETPNLEGKLINVTELMFQGSEKAGVPPLEANQVEDILQYILERVPEEAFNNPKELRSTVLDIAKNRARNIRRDISGTQDIATRGLKVTERIRDEEGQVRNVIDTETAKRAIQEQQAKTVEEIYGKNKQSLAELQERATPEQRIGVRNPFLLQFQSLLQKMGLGNYTTPPPLPKGYPSLGPEDAAVIETARGPFITPKSAAAVDKLLGRVPFERSSPYEAAKRSTTQDVIREKIASVTTPEKLQELQTKFLRKNPAASNKMLSMAIDDLPDDVKRNFTPSIRSFVEKYVGGWGTGRSLNTLVKEAGLEEQGNTIRVLLDQLATKVATSSDVIEERAAAQLSRNEAVKMMRDKMKAKVAARNAWRRSYMSRREGKKE